LLVANAFIILSTSNLPVGKRGLMLIIFSQAHTHTLLGCIRSFELFSLNMSLSLKPTY
jgi:hypothetical protein